MTWVWILMFVAIVANGIRLRLRTRALRVLPACEVDEEPSTDHRFLVARGVWLPEATRRAASAHARRCDLQVIDLVPSDLPVSQALQLIRAANPSSYRTNVLGPGVGAGHAIVAHRDVLERAGIEAGESLTPGEMARAVQQIKLHAPYRADLALAPGLRALDAIGPKAQEYWWRYFGEATGAIVAVHLLEYALLVLGLCLVVTRGLDLGGPEAPLFALLAFAAFQLQPWLIFWAAALKPRDLARQPVVRIGRAIADALGGAGHLFRSATSEDEASETKARRERKRAEYRDLLSRGTDPFFETRRDSCFLCQSENLALLIETPDLFHHKPGTFRLDRCGDCGHIFQNPRPSPDGLDFYYKDFYDGEWENLLELIFSAGDEAYVARANILKGHAEPKSWLDVGTGHGHFPLVARQYWPETRFDGLDQGSAVDVAHRRGWVDRVYRDSFPEVAPKIETPYDVVSMHHYLEHTTDPLRELDAAAMVLAPGGHLLIEVPDPEYFMGRWMGHRWIAWFQPQHLHFLTLGNLKAALRARGFEPLAEERGSAHQGIECAFWIYTYVDQIAPLVGMPWQPRASIAAHIWRWGVLVLCTPLFVGGLVADQLMGAYLRTRSHPSNTFRLLARKRPG